MPQKEAVKRVRLNALLSRAEIAPSSRCSSKLVGTAAVSPYDAIAAATVNLGKSLRKPKTVGLVAPGAQADLVLLKGHPLEDVKNLSQVAGVMRRGRWYPQQELQRGLGAMAAQ
jgi:imidazolonepropionase-like amidohydrolase